MRFIQAILLPLIIFSCGGKLEKESIDILCRNFSKEELSYYAEIGFGTEFGTGDNDRNSKWNKDIKIRVFGVPPYASDTLLLKKVANKLNEVIEPISIELTKGDDYNVEMHFVSLFDAHKVFGTEESHFGSSAQFKAPSFLGSIQHAQIVIYHESIERTRSKLIWEETIQILGLMQDSHKYPMSVFSFNDNKLNNNWHFKEPLPIDFQLLRILYNYDLPAHIKKSDFVSQIEKCF